MYKRWYIIKKIYRCKRTNEGIVLK